MGATKMSRHRQGGFSLVEVIIALALLGAVLISLSGLMTLGNRQVNSGRTQTQAVAVARDILEEMNGWGFHQTYEAFGLDGSRPDTNPPIDTRVEPFAAKWQPLLERELQDGWAEITLQSIDGTNNPPDLVLATAIRVVVTIHWREGPRSRSVQLATVRM
jgi:prepilin-type N-terminal cleavage/methylation domain-containing protein